MLTEIHPKLPMRVKATTIDYYERLGFEVLSDYGDYLIIERDKVEIHFFQFPDLNPRENYGMVYIRSSNVEQLYENFLRDGIAIHPNGPLETKPWGQKEFSLLDPDSNLLTFGSP